jgi:hypothetical protein
MNKNDHYIKLEVFGWDIDGKLSKYNILQRLSDQKYAIMTCDIINPKDPKKEYLEQFHLFIDAIKYGFEGDFYQSINEAIDAFLASFSE